MIGNNNIERKSSINILGVMLDKHISWIDHARSIENKLAKDTGLLYCARQFLNEDSLKTVYFWYIHSYLNYANIAWMSTDAMKLNTLFETKTYSTHCI